MILYTPGTKHGERRPIEKELGVCKNCGNPVQRLKGSRYWNHGGESWVCQRPDSEKVTGYSFQIERGLK